MNSDINLISNQDRESVEKRKRVKIVRVIAIIALFFTAFISILTFALNQQISLSGLKKEQNSILQSMSLLSNRSAKLYFVNDRLKNILEILKQRKSYISIVNTILGDIPSEVSATALEVDKDNILLTVSSNSLFPMNKFLNNFIDLSFKKHLVKDVTIETLTIDKEGGYSLSVKAKLL